MTNMNVRDNISFDASGLTVTADGFLIGDAKVSRAGNIQTYLGLELGLLGDDSANTFSVYRDPDVIFDEQSMMSLAGRPVTRNHPNKPVTADNYKELSVGQMGGIIKRDGEHVVAPMAIMDATAVKEVMDGARSLSAGYTVEITKEDGITPDGQPYQFRQSGNLRFNHVAYLPDNNPRAGNTRFGDQETGCIWGRAPLTIDQTSETKGKQMSDALKVMVLGDAVAHVSATDAAIVEKFKADTAKTISDMEEEFKKKSDDKDKELAEKDGEIKKLKDAALSDEALDKRIEDRANLIATAKAIVSDVEVKGLSDAEIRKAVVTKKLGDDAVKDRSEAFIDARFEILAEDVDTDPLKQVLSDRQTQPKATADAWAFLDEEGAK